jgi:hypothetical protein
VPVEFLPQITAGAAAQLVVHEEENGIVQFSITASAPPVKTLGDRTVEDFVFHPLSSWQRIYGYFTAKSPVYSCSKIFFMNFDLS